MNTVFISNFSWHRQLWIYTRSCFFFFLGLAPDCRVPVLHHFSLTFPDCPHTLVTLPLAFQMKATDYLQLRKHLIVKCITWGMTVKRDFFHFSLLESSTEIQHYWSPQQAGPVLPWGCHEHRSSYQHPASIGGGPACSTPSAATAAQCKRVSEQEPVVLWVPPDKKHRHGNLNSTVQLQKGRLANEGAKKTNIQEFEAI